MLIARTRTVCSQCRLRKIRCDRQRPQCSNCVRFGFECEWSGLPTQSWLHPNQAYEFNRFWEEKESDGGIVRVGLSCAPIVTVDMCSGGSLRCRIKAISELHSRLDHLVGAVSNIEALLRNLRSQVPTALQGSQPPMIAPSESQQPLIVGERDFGSGTSTSHQPSQGMRAPNPNGPHNISNNSNASLPPQIAAAAQILAAYIQSDPNNHEQSRQSSSLGNASNLPLYPQQHHLQAVQNVSTSDAANSALTALFTQADDLAMVSALSNAMYDPAPSIPPSQHDEYSLHGSNHSIDSSQGYSPVSLPNLQRPIPQQGESTFLAQPPMNGNLPRSQNNEFMEQQNTFFTDMQDSLPPYQ